MLFELGKYFCFLDKLVFHDSISRGVNAWKKIMHRLDTRFSISFHLGTEMILQTLS